MKKLAALFLALLMTVSLCACGGDTPDPTDTTQDNTTTTTTPVVTTEPETTTEPAKQTEMATIETNKFTVSYPVEDGWSCEEDDISDRDAYSSILMRIYDEDDYMEIGLSISASMESPHTYREDLYDRGFDAYALVVENAYDFVTIGGQQLLQWDNSDGDNRYYFGRNESAGVTMSVRVLYGIEDERVARVLDTLEFHIEETGNVDGPWYWEGEPFYRESMSATVGDYTLTSQFLPMAEPVITHDSSTHDIEIVGDKAYILSEGVLKEFAYDGAGLTYVGDVALDATYAVLEATNDGTLILSNISRPCIGYRDGAVTFRCSGTSYIAAAPDGTWGVNYFVTPADVKKGSIADGDFAGEAMPLTEMDSLSRLWMDGSYIYAVGRSAETGNHTVFLYDHAGTLQMTLTRENGLGSVTFVTKTANGFLALDGNMRKVVLWSADGTYLGEIDDGDLFGTNYPWFCAADVQSDGSIVVILTEDREDDSAMELVAFRLTGF